MKRRKRIIWWESGVTGRPNSSGSRLTEYDEWARHNVEGFVPMETYVPPPEPRVAGPVPERLQTLGEVLTQSLADQGLSVPQAASIMRITVDQFIDWALDRADPGSAYDQAVMAYLSIDYYTLRGLTLRSQMRRVQLRIHRLPA
jgi:hypothetical protein